MSDGPKRALYAEELVWAIVVQAPDNYHLGELRTSCQNGNSLVVSDVAYQRQRRKIHARERRLKVKCRILPKHCEVKRYAQAKRG